MKNNIFLILITILFISCFEKKVIWDKVYLNEDDKLYHYSSAPFSGVRYLSNPNLEVKQYFVDGKRIWHKEYRDNKLRFEQHFNNEDEYKNFKKYYENGNLESEGEYCQEYRYVEIIDISYKTKFKTPYTKFKEYYENGELKLSCKANKDENSYSERGYYENGKLEYEVTFKDLNETTIRYYESGQLKKERYGRIIKKYSEKGKLIYINPSWDCGPNGCFDPGNGIGEYWSLYGCQVLCKNDPNRIYHEK